MATDLSDEDRKRLDEGMQPIPIEEANIDRAVEWLISKIGGANEHIQNVVRVGTETAFKELTDGAEPGDRVYLCRSRYIGPMAGHEGLGLVRDEVVVRYKSLINY